MKKAILLLLLSISSLYSMDRNSRVVKTLVVGMIASFASSAESMAVVAEFSPPAQRTGLHSSVCIKHSVHTQISPQMAMSPVEREVEICKDEICSTRCGDKGMVDVKTAADQHPAIKDNSNTDFSRIFDKTCPGDQKWRPCIKYTVKDDLRAPYISKKNLSAQRLVAPKKQRRVKQRRIRKRFWSNK